MDMTGIQAEAMVKLNAGEPMTVDERLDPAMVITDQGDADDYFAALVKWQELHKVADAETVVKANLGYYAGYMSDSTRARVESLYSTRNPILGKNVIEY
jgi:hypothetical protein